MIREITPSDLQDLLQLYTQLHDNPIPEDTEELQTLWQTILQDKNHHINCYKMMLLTGSKKESTLHFYEQAGYNRKDKTAFIQWL